MVGDVHDVITCAMFQVDVPIDFCMGLTTVQHMRSLWLTYFLVPSVHLQLNTRSMV